MQHRPLGKTGLNVSLIGFGSAPVGFLATERSEAATLLGNLLDQGINLIDTAAMYPGSEELIGDALAHRRREFVLVSKCGAGWNKPADSDWTAEGITRYVDRSLQRLKTDAIDVMLLHSCSLDTLKQGEALGALVKARDAGKIRFAGYSGDNDAVAWAAAQPDVAVVETSINIADQVNIEMALPVARKHNVGVIAKRPIANAAWKPLDSQPGMYRSYAKTYTDRLAAMNLKPAELGFADTEMAELALRFALSQLGVSTAIVGTTNPTHLAANIAAAEKGTLPADVLLAIQNAFNDAQTASGKPWLGQT